LLVCALCFDALGSPRAFSITSPEIIRLGECLNTMSVRKIATMVVAIMRIRRSTRG
jgi:hypothetical protein